MKSVRVLFAVVVFSALTVIHKETSAQQTKLPSPVCQNVSEGKCWIEISNQPNCYFLVHYFDFVKGKTWQWSGQCRNGRMQGSGVLESVWKYPGSYIIESYRGEGAFMNGNQHGDWVERFGFDDVTKGRYVNGERHGIWVSRSGNSSWEGRYLFGKRSGEWTERPGFGTVGKGRYLNDKRHGHWVWRFSRDGILEGRYVNGERQGVWTRRFANDEVWKMRYVKGLNVGCTKSDGDLCPLDGGRFRLLP